MSSRTRGGKIKEVPLAYTTYTVIPSGVDKEKGRIKYLSRAEAASVGLLSGQGLW